MSEVPPGYKTDTFEINAVRSDAKVKTVTVQIGNSDNKLTQAEWSEFVNEFGKCIEGAATLHFFASSIGHSPWQNAAWVFEIGDNQLETMALQVALTDIRAKFKQDALAWTEGETVFL